MLHLPKNLLYLFEGQVLALSPEAFNQTLIGNETSLRVFKVVECQHQVLVDKSLALVDYLDHELGVVDHTIIMQIQISENGVDVISGHIRARKCFFNF